MSESNLGTASLLRLNNMVAAASSALQNQESIYRRQQQPKPLSSGPKRPVLSKHKRFLVFIKVMFKLMDQNGEHLLLRQAKTVVAECTKRNRMGDPVYTPLQDAVVVRLRFTPGCEAYWNLTRDFLGYDCSISI